MDSAQKYIKKQIREFVLKGYYDKNIATSIFMPNDYVMIIDKHIHVSPKNEQLVRDELERVRKIVDSPLYQVLNSVDKPKKP